MTPKISILYQSITTRHINKFIKEKLKNLNYINMLCYYYLLSMINLFRVNFF